MLRPILKRSSPPLLVQGERPLREVCHKEAVLLLAIGFHLSATAVFSLAYLVGQVATADRLSPSFRVSVLAVVWLVLAAADFVVWRRRRTCSIGIARQTPKNLLVRFGIRRGPFLWGLDTGLAVTTFRMVALTWAAFAGLLLGLSPWWAGVVFGSAFSWSLVGTILGPPRSDITSGPASEPQWVLRVLVKCRHRVQLGSTVALLASALWISHTLVAPLLSGT